VPWVPPLLQCHSSAVAGIAARSPYRTYLIPAPVSLSAAFPSAALNRYNLVFDLYRPSRRALQFSGKCPSAMFRQLLLPRFSKLDPCDELAAPRPPRHLLKSQTNVSKPRHQTIAITASLSAQLFDRGRSHRLRTSLAGFGSPPLFTTLSPPSAMPPDPYPESILIRAAGPGILVGRPRGGDKG